MEVFSKICDLPSLERAACGAFIGGNLGELFLEYKEEEVLSIENGIIQPSKFQVNRGFGLRTFQEDVTRYSYSSNLTAGAVKSVVASGHDAAKSVEIVETSDLYSSENFIRELSLEEKIAVLKKIDSYAQKRYPEIIQLTAVLAGTWQAISIFTDEGKRITDVRPLVRLTVSAVIQKQDKRESGYCSKGGRYSYNILLQEVESFVDEAVRQASAKIFAKPAPAGEMPVVLGNAWTGVLLHEAVGHGLEGDAIRKKTSSFYNLLGEQIASEKVTVVDDGTIPQRRGSLNVDDEGTATSRTVLIENGKLVGFMQDRMNARLMNMPCTGNGRRESFECVPMPRMTNTFMLTGESEPEELIANVSRGIYAKTFSGGQVDTASGKFVFNASEAYMIEDGKISYPVKGATLIGDGPSILKKIQMVAKDFSLDEGVGTCGKNGQWVPVGVGEPSVLISEVTIGGSDL